MSYIYTNEIKMLRQLREDLLLREEIISEGFQRLTHGSVRLVQNFEQELQGLRRYLDYLLPRVRAVFEAASLRTSQDSKSKVEKSKLEAKSEAADPSVMNAKDEIDGCSSIRIVEASSASSMNPAPVPYIVRPSLGEQRQFIRFSTERLEGSRPPERYVMWGIFDLELGRVVHKVNLLIKSMQEKFELIVCFPHHRELTDKISNVEVMINVLDHSGLPAIAKNYVFNTKSGCHRTGDRNSCKCASNPRGNEFINSDEVPLFKNCMLMKRKRPHLMIQLNTRVIMRIIHSKDHQSNDHGEDEVDSASDHLMNGNDSISLNNSMSFIPVEDIEEEILTGLSFDGKQAYKDWVRFKHLQEWRKNARVNVELLHFAHLQSLHELANHVVSNLKGIPHDECSFEENLEIVTAGALYGDESLYRRSLDHLGTRIA